MQVIRSFPRSLDPASVKFDQVRKSHIAHSRNMHLCVVIALKNSPPPCALGPQACGKNPRTHEEAEPPPQLGTGESLSRRSDCKLASAQQVPPGALPDPHENTLGAAPGGTGQAGEPEASALHQLWLGGA